MSVVVVTAFPVPDHLGPDEPGIELYALHKGLDRLVIIEKYESEQARSEHPKGAALAGLRSALDGKLSSNLDA
jgi:quinol monooxygenase YgiN